MSRFRSILAALAAGHPFSQEEAREAFSLILQGEASPAQLGAFLMGLRQRGESPQELIGAAQAMRAAMLPVEAPTEAIDIVGTGGDGANTYNISTLSAIVTAACGVAVAKHGGKAASSRSGASDVLGELGVKVGLDPAAASACLREAGICFMAAPTHHPALRHAAPVRSELGLRTIFNLLGPICNPAGVERQVLGVYSRKWLEPMALALPELGSRNVWLLHGSDGLDEATTTGPTYVVALENGALRSFEISPADAGLPLAAAQDLVGGDPAFNARALRDVLGGAKNAYRDIATLNAAVALIVAGKAKNLKEGAQLAAEALDSGAAGEKLELLAQVSNRLAAQA
ncbi:anthranilate phosphoribosyltransferase [Methylocystis heyeri]|uniref:Anthranilate phosphoribosyltransferase n=1 Tax=Methylocystis heyeri TaxID=391905 RepID=A0A6B8KK27_9HYPH|nr:anthranilate phosphoribosyltransferase [Methylocystis heyeri]QGM46970.1 anthranilate phosphoribosyltransferase [Methylocystis heyeri]